MGQIPLPFSTDMASDDFIVTPCNEDAAAMLQNWQHWPYRSAVITGPEKSGKTVMGRVFAHMASGIFVDNLDRHDEAEIFHMWNIAQQAGQPILLSLSPDGDLDDVNLPDLKSRLNASQAIAISAPDEAMMAALFEKLCHQSGLNVNARMADYVKTRCERSYVAVTNLVAQLNHWALASKKPIGIKAISEILDANPYHEEETI